MGPFEIILIIIASCVVIGTVVGAIIRKKKGKVSDCCSSCSNCPYSSSGCPSVKTPSKEEDIKEKENNR